MRASLRPEAPSHVARDHTHLGPVEFEDLGESGAYRVRSLSGIDMVQASVVSPAARCNARFQRARCDAVVDRADLGDGLARVEIGLLVVERHADNDVRLRHAVEQRRTLQCFFGIDERLQRLVVDDDHLRCVDRCGRGVCDHDGDGLADEPHPLGSQHRAHDGGIERRVR